MEEEEEEEEEATAALYADCDAFQLPRLDDAHDNDTKRDYLTTERLKEKISHFERRFAPRRRTVFVGMTISNVSRCLKGTVRGL